MDREREKERRFPRWKTARIELAGSIDRKCEPEREREREERKRERELERFTTGDGASWVEE